MTSYLIITTVVQWGITLLTIAALIWVLVKGRTRHRVLFSVGLGMTVLTRLTPLLAGPLLTLVGELGWAVYNSIASIIGFAGLACLIVAFLRTDNSAFRNQIAPPVYPGGRPIDRFAGSGPSEGPYSSNQPYSNPSNQPFPNSPTPPQPAPRPGQF